MLNANPSPVNGRVQSIDRAAELLAAIAAAPGAEAAPALADRCGLNRSTAWRILATLEHHGLVERDPDSNRYRLGFAVLRLAAAAGHEPLVRLAHPVLLELAEATGETANLAVARRLELVYADQVQARHVMAPDWMGHAVPLHATSTGKAFLAALPAPGARRAPAGAAPGLHRHHAHASRPRCAPSSTRSARAAGRSRAASSSSRCGASPRRSATAPGAPPPSSACGARTRACATGSTRSERRPGRRHGVSRRPWLSPDPSRSTDPG